MIIKTHDIATEAMAKTLLDFLFASAIFNSLKKAKHNSSQPTHRQTSDYDHGYEDGYDDSCYNHGYHDDSDSHDTEDYESHDSYDCDCHDAYDRDGYDNDYENDCDW